MRQDTNSFAGTRVDSGWVDRCRPAGPDDRVRRLPDGPVTRAALRGKVTDHRRDDTGIPLVRGRPTPRAEVPEPTAA